MAFRGGQDGAPPRYDEVVSGYTPSAAVRGAGPAATNATPSAPTESIVTQQQRQNLPSILRSSSPPVYWTQRQHRGGSLTHNTAAPSAPEWGDHLPSVREEQAPEPQQYPSPGSHTPHNQQPEPRLCSRAPKLFYKIWRGFPVTSQRFTGDLQKAWCLGAGFIRKVLWVTIPSRSVYRWLIMQLVLAGMALLFSMMPNRFFEFDTIQWLLTTVLVLTVVDFAIAVFLQHPNRTSRSSATSFKTCFGLTRSCFYDLFLYPTLILSIFQIIRTQSYLIFHGQGDNFNNEDTWEFATFSVVASLYVMTVYIMRIGAFSSAVSGLLHNYTDTRGSRKIGAFFLKGFLVQIVVQVAIQIMLLIMIGVRYQAERGGGYNVYGEESTSKFLNVMIAGGLLIPMLSLPMYFVSTQKQVEEFPISLFLNTPSEQRAIRTTNPSDINTFKTEFARFHKYNTSVVGVLANVLQPLFSPVQVIPCAVYTLLLLSFFVCFSITHNENVDTGHMETVNAFNVGLYSNIYSMPRTVTEGTFVVALLATIATNFLPMVYGMVGAVLLPLHLIVGGMWLLVKTIRSRQYLSVQTV